MSLQENLNALNARLQKVLKPGADEILEQHMESLTKSGFLDQVLQAGAHAPAFTLQDQHGQLISSEHLLRKGPLVVCFTRGGWCPFCNEEAKAYDAIYDQFRKAGADIVFVTPQSLAGIQDWEQKNTFHFSILRDEGHRIGEAFGVVYTFPDNLRDLYEHAFAKDIPLINEAEGWKLPVPACFVIDTEGIIRFAEANPNYRIRPEPEEALTLVSDLAPATL